MQSKIYVALHRRGQQAVLSCPTRSLLVCMYVAKGYFLFLSALVTLVIAVKLSQFVVRRNIHPAGLVLATSTPSIWNKISLRETLLRELES